MRQCPNCKSDNPDDARFCNYCGMRLPESKEEHYIMIWKDWKKPEGRIFRSGDSRGIGGK